MAHAGNVLEESELMDPPIVADDEDDGTIETEETDDSSLSEQPMQVRIHLDLPNDVFDRTTHSDDYRHPVEATVAQTEFSIIPEDE